MTTEPYGAPGCRCWAETNGVDDVSWYPAAQCPHHGILAGYTRPRTDTGTYRVVDLDLPTGDIVAHDDAPPVPDWLLEWLRVRGIDSTGLTLAQAEAIAKALAVPPCERHPGASTIAGECALCPLPLPRVDDEERYCKGTAKRWANCSCTLEEGGCELPEPQRRGCSCSVNEPEPCPYCAEVVEQLSHHNRPITPAEAERMSEIAAEEPGPGDCSWGEPFACGVHCPANPMDCPGPAADGTCLFDGALGSHDHIPGDGGPICVTPADYVCVITEKRSGVLATVRRWLSPGYWLWEWERPWRK